MLVKGVPTPWYIDMNNCSRGPVSSSFGLLCSLWYFCSTGLCRYFPQVLYALCFTLSESVFHRRQRKYGSYLACHSPWFYFIDKHIYIHIETCNKQCNYRWRVFTNIHNKIYEWEFYSFISMFICSVTLCKVLKFRALLCVTVVICRFYPYSSQVTWIGE